MVVGYFNVNVNNQFIDVDGLMVVIVMILLGLLFVVVNTC